MNPIAREFWSRMDAAEQKLSLVTEAEARQPFRPDGWTRKEILGHLVDSATVNHVRFVFAATQGHYEGPVYSQDGWVALHGYSRMPWPAVLDQWRARYTWMAEMITNMPESSMAAPITLGDHPPVRLDDWIRDCLNHLEHHVTQIVRVAATA